VEWLLEGELLGLRSMTTESRTPMVNVEKTGRRRASIEKCPHYLLAFFEGLGSKLNPADPFTKS